MSCEPTVNDFRNKLERRPECSFVDRGEFCRLLVSRHQLIRSDEAAANVRGLMERVTGTRFLIEEEKLFPTESVARPAG